MTWMFFRTFFIGIFKKKKKSVENSVAVKVIVLSVLLQISVDSVHFIMNLGGKMVLQLFTDSVMSGFCPIFALTLLIQGEL